MKDVRFKEIYVTMILIGINMLLFVVPLILYGGMTTELIVAMGAQYWPLIKAGEWWRLITCNFLHFSVGHLMSNMIMLFALGANMEPCLGHIKYSVIYLLSGIAGAGLSYAVNMLSASAVVAAGASTCVYGLLGAMACFIFLGYGRRIGISISAKQFILLAALNILANVIGESSIDYMGHLGGFVAGALICIVLGTVSFRKQEADNT